MCSLSFEAHAEQLQWAEYEHERAVKASIVTATEAFRERYVAMMPYCPSRDGGLGIASLLLFKSPSPAPASAATLYSVFVSRTSWRSRCGF